MVGLLFALPGTQLTRRLAREGRLHAGFDRVVPASEMGDQCTSGINFESVRPRIDILRDLRRILSESFAAAEYFDRVRRVGTRLNCSQKQLNVRWRDTLRDLTGLARLVWKQGVRKPYRHSSGKPCGAFCGATRPRCVTPSALRPCICTLRILRRLRSISWTAKSSAANPAGCATAQASVTDASK